ncbi:protein NLP7-like [Rhododendron vialii]|uniref:protein NLP7-like n=1 Tax=Rhododendron vialii TaxID=182163 RepID=UPI00265E62EA|nr:protein NLP7-like [Rhododendron vialii]
MAALRKNGESDTGFEESEEMMTCFYFPPSPPSFFPLYLPASPPLQSSPSSSYSGCLGEVKTRENKEENGARIAIPFEDILQTKAMRLKDAAKHLKVSILELKSSCREYGIRRWPPRNEHKLIRQSLLNETPTVVDQEGIPQFTSHSNQVLMVTVDKNSVVEKEIPPPQLLPTAKQENSDAGSGNDEVEAIVIGVEGTREGVIEKAPLNSECSGKGKCKLKSPGGDRRHNKTTRVKIAIPKQDILQTKEMRLKDAAKHLEVSRSTFKRACREYGIERWPPHKECELISQSDPNESPAVVDQEQIRQLNYDTLLPSAQVSATIGTNIVTIMARYAEVRIKFRLSWPWRMVELEQQVKKRLPLEAGTYYIKYKDEDDGLLTLIACDEDLEDYISSSSRLGTHPIEVFLEPKLASSWVTR